MANSFHDDSMNPPRYKFISGQGDSEHENRLNELAVKGYNVTLMAYDSSGAADNTQVIVLMERK